MYHLYQMQKNSALNSAKQEYSLIVCDRNFVIICMLLEMWMCKIIMREITIFNPWGIKRTYQIFYHLKSEDISVNSDNHAK